MAKEAATFRQLAELVPMIAGVVFPCSKPFLSALPSEYEEWFGLHHNERLPRTASFGVFF